MTATAARIGFIMSEFRRVVATTQVVKDRYGALARESEDPIPPFFDSPADAQTVADARQTLLKAERRRFRVATKDNAQTINLDLITGIPVATYVDTERDISRPMLVSEITFDLGKDTTLFTVWG